MMYKKGRAWLNDCSNSVIRINDGIYFATFKQDQDPVCAATAIIDGVAATHWRIWEIPSGIEYNLADIEGYVIR